MFSYLSSSSCKRISGSLRGETSAVSINKGGCGMARALNRLRPLCCGSQDPFAVGKSVETGEIVTLFIVIVIYVIWPHEGLSELVIWGLLLNLKCLHLMIIVISGCHLTQPDHRCSQSASRATVGLRMLRAWIRGIPVVSA